MISEQVLVLGANIGDVSDRKLRDFKDSFMGNVENDTGLKELSEEANIDISLNENAVVLVISSENNIDIVQRYPQLTKTLIEAFSVIYIDRIEGIEINHIEIFKVNDQLIDEKDSKENKFGFENVIAKGYKYAITRNQLNADLVIEPDYAGYHNSNLNQIFFSIKSGEKIQSNDVGKINKVISRAQDNYKYYFGKTKDSIN